MKSEIVAKVAADTGMTKADAEKAFTAVFAATLAVATGPGKKAIVPGFGIFTKEFREGREGRNPATGETIQIAAREVLKFRPAKGVI